VAFQSNLLRIAVIAGATVAVACGGKGSGDGSAPPNEAGARTAHPMRDSASTAVQDLVADSTPGDANAKEVTGILGYNDEQRLQLDGGGTRYGPVARLYTIRRARTEAEYRRGTGAMVAVLEVDSIGSTVPAAYRRIGVKPSDSVQVYCVFLQRRDSAGQPEKWWGGVSHSTGGACDTAVFNIKTDSATPTTNGNADWPEWAVRFTEGTAHFPALGVRCYNALCEIGNNAGGSSVSNGAGQGHVKLVKTWHDNQRLATAGGSGNPPWIRGPEMTITPVDSLGNITAGFRTSDGRQAATIMLQSPLPAGAKYIGWKLRANDSTQVWLRNLDSTNGKWQMRLITPTTHETTKWKDITRNDHTPGLVPGTARWKWDPQDEGIWVACEQGCCEMTGGFTFVITGNGDTIWIPPNDSGGRGRSGGNP
jgi:hypothetical protein